MGKNDFTPEVLIVDDQEKLADLYTYWLQETYTVRTAYSGEEALEMLDDEVDVVLLDRDMPEVTGDDVLDRMRERGLNCYVTMVTGERPDIEIIDMQFDDYLVKPVTSDDLYDAVERMIDRSTYENRLPEYFALASKRAALQEYVSSEMLADSEAYDELEEELTEFKVELNESIADFDTEDFEHAFQSLETSAETTN